MKFEKPNNNPNGDNLKDLLRRREEIRSGKARNGNRRRGDIHPEIKQTIRLALILATCAFMLQKINSKTEPKTNSIPLQNPEDPELIEEGSKNPYDPEKNPYLKKYEVPPEFFGQKRESDEEVPNADQFIKEFDPEEIRKLGGDELYSEYVELSKVIENLVELYSKNPNEKDFIPHAISINERIKGLKEEEKMALASSVYEIIKELTETEKMNLEEVEKFWKAAIGNKVMSNYKNMGIEGLQDRSTIM